MMSVGQEDRVAFTFHRCLGAGGYGEVYLATQHLKSGIQRTVAVKVLRSDLDEASDAVKRLRDEGQILAMLSHPSILNVHEFAQVDGRVALVTEYVEGVDVAACIDRQNLPLKVALSILAEVADALHFAWHTKHPNSGRELHLIHRDIKPENVRVSMSGEVKLLDFGIARSTEMKRRAKTAAGDVLMTPGYGAPEALTYGVASPSVDIYALGVTLFRMVTMQKLFEGKPLSFQVSLAMDTVDYKEFMKARLRLVKNKEVRRLLADMLSHAPEHRPLSSEVRDRCEDIAAELDGPTLLKWVKEGGLPRSRSRPKGGELAGKEVTVSGAVIAAGEAAKLSDLSAAPEVSGEAPTELPPTEQPTTARDSGKLPPPPPPPELSTGTINPEIGKPADLPPPLPPGVSNSLSPMRMDVPLPVPASAMPTQKLNVADLDLRLSKPSPPPKLDPPKPPARSGPSFLVIAAGLVLIGGLGFVLLGLLGALYYALVML